MIVNIEKADEIPDFSNHLGDLDDIFFKSSVKRDFCTHEEQQYFRDMSFGRYTVKHRDSFFVALNGGGRAIGYLAGCLKNPTKLGHFNDVTYFSYIEDICKLILHTFILILRSITEAVGLGRLSLSDLSIGQRLIRFRESRS